MYLILAWEPAVVGENKGLGMKGGVNFLSRPVSKQKGIVIIFFVIALPVLLTMMALALDTGNLFIVKTELQNATDACALSAATELDGTAAQFNRAQEAGRLAGVAHKVNLQKVAVAFPNDSAVTFAPAIDGSYIPASAGSELSSANAATYKFVKCTANSTTDKLITVPTLSTSDTVTAQAIASRLPIQSPCVLPIGVCSNTNAVTTNTVGAWISGEVGKNGTCVGNVNCYKWLVYGSATPNASNLANLLTGNNTCGINLAGQSVTEFSGAAASPFDEYNTRFGVQKGTNPVNPDFTGHGYTPATYTPAATYTPSNSLFAINAYNNATDSYISKKTALAKYQDNPNLPGYTTIQPTTANANSRRIGIVPVIPCTGGTSTVTNYMCVLMLNPIAGGGSNKTLYLEYLGSSNAGSCTQIGFAGGGTTGPTVSALVQ